MCACHAVLACTQASILPWLAPCFIGGIGVERLLHSLLASLCFMAFQTFSTVVPAVEHVLSCSWRNGSLRSQC